jgi:hypothetical protein
VTLASLLSSLTVAKVVCACQMPIERCGVELRQHVDLADTAVDAVAHRHVNEPVCAADGHRRLGALLCERVQPAASASTQDDGCVQSKDTYGHYRLHHVSHDGDMCIATAALSQSLNATENAGLLSCAPAMLLDTDRIELFICASRSMTALTGMVAGSVLSRSVNIPSVSGSLQHLCQFA